MQISDINKEKIFNFLQKINDDIEDFVKTSIELSSDVERWSFLSREFETRKCWEILNCSKNECPAFKNEDYRCWLIAGTLCYGEVQGEFTKKYHSCFKCDIFEIIHNEPLRALYENVDILINHLQRRARNLREISVKDHLTGLYNRRYLNEVINREMARSSRRSEQIAFLMIDIDNFKSINDTFGHLTGDKLISESAKLIKNTVRQSDLVFRYGGDEFLVLMENAGLDHCNTLIGRILKAVKNWNVTYSGKFCCKLSLSIGCSVCDKNGDFKAALKKADENMYKNKARKRNML